MEVTTSAEALRRQRAALGGSATTWAAMRLNAICAVAHMAFYVLFPVMRCRHPCPLRSQDRVVVLQRITSCLTATAGTP